VDPTTDRAARKVVQVRRAALIACACAALAGFASALIRAAAPSAPDTRLFFTGDILLSRQVLIEIDRTRRSPWTSIAPLFAKADWLAGNFEGAIGPSSDCLAATDSLCFAAPDSAASLLARAGFKAVSLENNHDGDLGAAGRVRTRATLRRAGILGLDFAASPRFIRIGDLTMALIAVTTVRAADGEQQVIPSTELAQKLRLARALANLVVVTVHWGTELHDWPSEAQRSGAAWLVDHGADLVVGHHPHVVQPPECIHGRPVFFSLGNHVFDQKYPETKLGLIADCTVHGGRLRCGGIRTRTRQGSAVPVDAGAMQPDPLSECSTTLVAPATFAGYSIRPEPWTATTSDSGVVLEGWRDGVRRWRTRRAQLVTLERGLATTDGSTLLLTLERHPSAMDGEIALRPHVYAVDGRGLVAKWRGTALAWPLLDAIVDKDGALCALHRGDSFVRPDPTTAVTRTMRYRWNGFGFSAADDRGNECALTMHALAGH